MNEESFVKKREPDWQRFKLLSDRAEASLSSLSADEFAEYVTLYRRVSGDLALVRTVSTNPALAEFLNQMVVKGYGTLYRHRTGDARSVLANSVFAIAQCARRNQGFIFLATGLFFAAAIGAGLLSAFIPATSDYLIPPGWEEVVKRWTDGTHDAKTASDSLAATGFYATNNPMAAVSTVALSSVSFGLMTFLILLQNGALLGALGLEMIRVGKLDFLLVSIAPHGVTELSGIFVAGGAGFRLGWAVIRPGRLSRGESLRVAGQDALILTGAAMIMMFMAAPIEAFFSFNPAVPQPIKAVFACLSAFAWFWFWKFVGRDRPSTAGG